MHYVCYITFVQRCERGVGALQSSIVIAFTVFYFCFVFLRSCYRTHTHTRAHTHTRTHARAYTHAHKTRTHPPAHARIRTHTHAHTYTRADRQTDRQINKQTNKHVLHFANIVWLGQHFEHEKKRILANKVHNVRITSTSTYPCNHFVWRNLYDAIHKKSDTYVRTANWEKDLLTTGGKVAGVHF